MDKSDLVQAIHQALKSWHHPEAEPGPLSYLHLFRQIQREVAPNLRQTTNELLHRALKALAIDFPEDARLLRLHYLDQTTMFSVANRLNISEATAHRRQQRAISRLTEALARLEAQAQARTQTVLESRLELPTYTKLVGVEDPLNELLTLVISPEPPWLVSIEGMGGLGKTSLADAVARRMIRQGIFDDFGWVSARRQDFNPGRGIQPAHMPALTAENLIEQLYDQLMADQSRPAAFSLQAALAALRSRLKQHAHLIVVDNLETLVDIEALLPTLRDLSNPSKFLLTSRESLFHEHAIYHFPLPELSEPNALHLIRHEARLRNSPYLQEADETALKKIFQMVGGNPLAIRLVVGQTHLYSLEAILSDLTAARGETVEHLYTFIYRRAWDSLDELTRRVLLAMPLVTEGEGTLEHLAELSEVDQTALRNALDRLVTLNLIDRKSSLTEQYYSIHNLTRTFLQEQVLRWF